jgi:hypothetical protein
MQQQGRGIEAAFLCDQFLAGEGAAEQAFDASVFGNRGRQGGVKRVVAGAAAIGMEEVDPRLQGAYQTGKGADFDVGGGE